MQSGELYDSGVAKHTLFEVTDIRKVMKGNAFSVYARQDRVFFGAGRVAAHSVFRSGGKRMRCGSADRRMMQKRRQYNRRCFFVWYAIQTMTGREQELIDTVNTRTDHNTYDRCFCVRREAVWRREGRYITHIEQMFPGYVFVETNQPEAFYLQLRKIPKFSRLLGKDISGLTGRKGLSKRRSAEKPVVRLGSQTGSMVLRAVGDDAYHSYPGDDACRHDIYGTGNVPVAVSDLTGVLFSADSSGDTAKRGSGKSGSRTARPAERDDIGEAITGVADLSENTKTAETEATAERTVADGHTGHATNYSNGCAAGYPTGHVAGCEAEKQAGYLIGHAAGHSTGCAAGYEAEKQAEYSTGHAAGGESEKQAGNGILFHAVSEEEVTFLEQLIGGDPENIVRLSPVELDENSEIIKCGGALRYYKDLIIKKRIRLRYVMVRVPLFGSNRDIRVDKEKILNAMDLD